MSLFESASLVVTPNGAKASKLYAIKPTSGAGDLSVTRATTATRVNSAGLIESVASNVPRLDYTNSTCPSILVEPQRTNLALYSEQFQNVYWGKFNTSINTNVTTAPDGNSTADKFVENTLNNFHSMDSTFTSGTGIHTATIFAKIGERRYLRLNITEITPAVDHTALFDLQTGTLLSNSTGVTATITSVVNGWYRIRVTSPALVGGLLRMAVLMQTTTSSTPQSYTGDGTSGIYLWGAQLEAGSYATSYIPTTTAAVTRNADVISKTGISSLIGQTEGTIFVEEVYDATVANNGGLDDTLVSLSDGTSSNLISIFHYGLGIGNVLFFIRLSNVTQVAISSSTPTSGTYKIALAYKNNDVVGYINGVQIGNDTSATIPGTSVISLVDPITTNAATKTVKRKNISVWKTRLTNAELAELTTL